MKNSVIFLLILLAPNLSYAYIDPGTGSAIVYIVIALVTSAYFAVKGAYYKIADVFAGRAIKREVCDIAIHSEDRRYELTFLPIMRHLSELGVAYTYYTMYERDDEFEELPENSQHQSISPGLMGYSFLNRLTANVFVTTTPQLDVMTFKRSNKVKHYLFVQHALGEAIYMRPFPYDFFDSVMCCGKTLKENILQLEKIRNSEPKALYDMGIAHYDELLKRRADCRVNSRKKVILVAPSWGELSLFKKYGTNFVALLADKFEVIVRPHPQMKISQHGLYKEVLALNNVEIDLNYTFEESMSRADILISDFSGIIHEFAFVYERPVIVADYEKELGGFEGAILNKQSEIAKICEGFIVSMSFGDLSQFDKQVEDVIANFSLALMRKVRGDLIYNFGYAGEKIAEKISEIRQCQS